MNYDCGFTKDNKWFRYRAAAIIVEDDCVLFAGNEKDDYYCSIGGAVHMGETAEDAVKREVLEETGVELVSMCTTEFRMTDPAYRQVWLDGLRESCEAAGRLGVRRLITQVGPDTGAPRAQQHESILAALRAGKHILEDSAFQTGPLDLLNQSIVG